MFSQLKRCLEKLNLGDFALDNYRSEFELFIKFYLWRYSICKENASVGQSLLRLKLINASSGDGGGLRWYQSYAYAIFAVILPYYNERFSFNLFNNKYNWLIKDFLVLFKILDLLNFFFYLKNGKYLNLWSRLFSIDLSSSADKKLIDTNSSQILIKNLLQQYLAESLAYVLPIFSVTRLRNKLVPVLFRFNFSRFFIQDVSSNPDEESEEDDDADELMCSICNESIINIHGIGCKHYFCYYCIMSNYLSDLNESFACPICLFKVNNVNQIKFAIKSI